MYFHMEQGQQTTVIVLYVDDLILREDDNTFIEKTKATLELEFEMTDMGHFFLGLEFWQVGYISLTKQRYVHELL